VKTGTWRRESGTWFAAIVLGVLIAEISVATLLTVSFIAQAVGAESSFPVQGLVIGGITIGAMGLLALTVYLIAFHVIGENRRRRHDASLEVWTTRWVAILFEQEPCPQGPLSIPAEDALIGLTESVSGPDAARLRRLISLYSIDERLIRDMSSKEARTRMAAFEGLAMARLPRSIDPLILEMNGARPEARTMAARAAARTIASLPAGPVRDQAALRFGSALSACEPAPGVFEEMLLLTDEAAVTIEQQLLQQPGLSSRLIAATIDAAGRSDATALFPWAIQHASSHDAETRAAVLRFLSRMDNVSPFIEGTIIVGLHDEIEFVRVNAVRAARKLAPGRAIHELWARLADPSWWVRKGAAESLAAMGPAGETVLRASAESHPDRYGRDMSAQVLVDSGISVDVRDAVAV
jgi:hypothetical protein